MDLLTNLRGFVAVADEMSVSGAADALDIDQPLLSRRIRALEAHLQVQLLDRSRRTIGLTPAALGLLPRARHLVEQADHLVETARRSGAARFAVTLPPRPAPGPLGRIVRLLTESGIEPVVRIGSTTNDEPGIAVEPCDAASATWRVPLGVAGRCGTVPGDPCHLVDLRPRRGADPLPLLVSATDVGQPWSHRLEEAADRAGIVPSQLRPVDDIGVAGALALAGAGVLVCSQADAAAVGLDWAAIADAGVARGYRVVETAALPEGPGAPARAALVQLLGEAVGAS